MSKRKPDPNAELLDHKERILRVLTLARELGVGIYSVNDGVCFDVDGEGTYFAYNKASGSNEGSVEPEFEYNILSIGE